VVMALMAVLAAIAVPVALSAQREAREAKLLAELHTIRSAVARYVADCGGFPDKLDDLVALTPPRNCRDVATGKKMRIDPVDFQGPYVYTPDEKFPKDPITRKREWSYDKRTGHVKSASKDTAMDGTLYKDW
jgi:type II secretory pathway pseudopilin PulG